MELKCLLKDSLLFSSDDSLVCLDLKEKDRKGKKKKFL